MTLLEEEEEKNKGSVEASANPVVIRSNHLGNKLIPKKILHVKKRKIIINSRKNNSYTMRGI